MSLRETLRAHPEINDDELDDVIEIAARLQDERRTEEQGVSADEIRAVATELDIDPSLVDEALAIHRRQRQAAEAHAHQRQSRRRRGLWVGGAVFLAALFAFAGTASTGAADLRVASMHVDDAERQLRTVLQRQVGLVPQMAALTGAEIQRLTSLREQFENAETVQQAIDAAAHLNHAVAQELAALPAPGSKHESQLRLQVQHELSGSQNRTSAERQRYLEAVARWEQVASGVPGRLALALGLASQPE